MKLALSFFFLKAAVCNIKTQQISNNIETSPPLSLQTWSGAAYCSISNYIIPSNCVLMVKKEGHVRLLQPTDPTEIPPFCCATFSVCWTRFLEAAHIFFYKVNERGHCSSGCFQWSLTPPTIRYKASMPDRGTESLPSVCDPKRAGEVPR